jgi:hypothetical protein
VPTRSWPNSQPTTDEGGRPRERSAGSPKLAARGLRTVFVSLPDLAGPDDLARCIALLHPELRSGEQVDGERHHLARAGPGQQGRRNRNCPPRPYRVVHQQHRAVEAHPVAHAGAGQQVPRPDR